MPTRSFIAVLAFAFIAVAPAQAVETALQLELSSDQDFDRRTVIYDCGGDTPLVVVYLNAAPNFLAILPVPDQTQPLVFASILSGSGARYASGHWIWESQGPDGALYDAGLGEDEAALLTCAEVINTP